MKKLKFLPLAALVLALFTVPACDFDDDGWFGDCEEGQGAAVEITLDVPDFTGVKLHCDAKVFITQGDSFEVVAKGEENVIELLELDVQDGTWDIEFDDCVRDYDLEIYVTMPEIEYLAVSGSGEIRGDNFFEVEDVVLRISGSGELCLGLHAQTIDAAISGSGETELEGTTEQLDFKISGSGDLHAFDLIAEKCDVNISGSGDASVNVTDVLDVKITGSGNVFYKGHPTLNVDITGSGDVIDAN